MGAVKETLFNVAETIISRLDLDDSDETLDGVMNWIMDQGYSPLDLRSPEAITNDYKQAHAATDPQTPA